MKSQINNNLKVGCKNMWLISMFITIFLCIIGILFIVWSISFKYSCIRLVNKCTNSCEGILVKINEIKMWHQINNDGRWYYTISYVPIYEYEVQGNKYKIKGSNGEGFKIGEVVKINYNPQKPKQSYIDGYSFKSWKVLLIIGIAILIMSFGFILLIKLIFNS